MAEIINDRYELLEVIASGGMATVWRARDTRLDRVVALKRPHPAPLDDPSHRRMEREARAAASLSHPNLITVYDYGRDDAGPFLVMEMVEGSTLEEVARDTDPAEALEIGSELADALAAIHAAGVIHRDIKPANVLMSERGPLLTDFGVALHPDAISEITQPGKVVATPRYAAPEVLEGQPPTAASDVFSLAVVVHELLAGGRGGVDREAGLPPLTDPDLETALRPALSQSVEARPTAAALAAALRGTAPTLTAVSPGGSTIVMSPPAGPPPVAHAEDTSGSRRVLRLTMASLILLAILLALVTQVMSNPETPAAGTTSTTALPATTTTVSISTTVTTTPSTTVTVHTVDSARDELEAILLEAHRSDLNPPEVKDIMKKVDEAIEAAEEGDRDKATEKLGETAKKLEKSLEGERLTRARAALEQLAQLLGVSLEDDDDDD